RAYAAGSDNSQRYEGAGTLPPCRNFNFDDAGPRSRSSYKRIKIGHRARDCRSTANANVANRQRGEGAGQKATCYECGAQGHFKRTWPKLKNNNNNNRGRQQPPKRQDVARAYAARYGNRQQNLTNANVANNQRGNGAGQKVTCYDCGAQGHFKRYCPKLKNNNNNRGNQVGTGNAQARVCVVGNAGTNLDANTVT
nr:hypothetical protein [Tanacetum cinerariifolium]